jgi:hypothetical protein
MMKNAIETETFNVEHFSESYVVKKIGFFINCDGDYLWRKKMLSSFIMFIIFKKVGEIVSFIISLRRGKCIYCLVFISDTIK